LCTAPYKQPAISSFFFISFGLFSNAVLLSVFLGVVTIQLEKSLGVEKTKNEVLKVVRYFKRLFPGNRERINLLALAFHDLDIDGNDLITPSELCFRYNQVMGTGLGAETILIINNWVEKLESGCEVDGQITLRDFMEFMISLAIEHGDFHVRKVKAQHHHGFHIMSSLHNTIHHNGLFGAETSEGTQELPPVVIEGTEVERAFANARTDKRVSLADGLMLKERHEANAMPAKMSDLTKLLVGVDNEDLSTDWLITEAAETDGPLAPRTLADYRDGPPTILDCDRTDLVAGFFPDEPNLSETTVRADLPPLVEQRALRDREEHAFVGRRLVVQFDNCKWYSAVVSSYSAEQGLFKVEYEDGDVRWHGLDEGSGLADGRMQFRFEPMAEGALDTRHRVFQNDGDEGGGKTSPFVTSPFVSDKGLAPHWGETNQKTNQTVQNLLAGMAPVSKLPHTVAVVASKAAASAHDEGVYLEALEGAAVTRIHDVTHEARDKVLAGVTAVSDGAHVAVVAAPEVAVGVIDNIAKATAAASKAAAGVTGSIVRPSASADQNNFHSPRHISLNHLPPAPSSTNRRAAENKPEF
jgi:hypothetical protein